MPELPLSFIADADFTLAAGQASEVQIAKQGSFEDPRYGKFKITQADFRKWIENFSLLSKANGSPGLPVDVDHSPEKQGVTEAAGWVTGLVQKGKELWAQVEWNDLGQELVKNRRYAFLSPSYVANYKDESGKEFGTALRGVGLTNRPFLSMAAVSLSADEGITERSASVVQEQERLSDSLDRMPLLDELRTTFGLSADASEADVLAAAAAAKETPEPTPAPESEKTLAEQAAEQGAVILSKDELAALNADVQQGKAAAAELHQAKFEAAFDKALSEGKAVPALKDQFASLYKADSESTLTLLDGLTPVVNTTQRSQRGEDGEVLPDHSADMESGEELDEERAALDAKVQKLLSKDTTGTLTYATALARIGA